MNIPTLLLVVLFPPSSLLYLEVPSMSAAAKTTNDSAPTSTARRVAWHIPASQVAQRTLNPIRQIVDHMKIAPNKDKEMISLSIGDPTIYGNFDIDEFANEAMIKYTIPTAPLTANDVIIGSGASDALNICITGLCDSGTNILLPRPGFPLYETLATSKGIEVRYYNLLVDLGHLESLVDDKTSCILVNNPSNPCGSVYTRPHLEQILALCARHHLPVISDEIYDGLPFAGNVFHPIASLTDEVPVLAVGGIAKQYCVPGWRVGWILIHDRNDVLKEVCDVTIAFRSISRFRLRDGALPEILHNTPQKFYDDTLAQFNAFEVLLHFYDPIYLHIKKNAKISQEMVSKIPGLRVVVGINVGEFKDIKSDIEFTEKLVAEESVMCLPGQCFKYPNFFRIVITPPADRLEEAYQRMTEFCARHHVDGIGVKGMVGNGESVF
ncbi:tyrosine aminotransferase [Jimgerdemannia flammicorona]|uniref:Tyrosine aminotransferase n=1 Tax=Jimgerdemannia flammicorona TaxID=994334 RepID=A0A433QN86_9FUNG|nr:tyrosine aminotransferase [Jimgerdemannia flammicorona]